MDLSIDRLQQALGTRYRLLSELGGGNMASVFLADDLRHGRQVAIKVLRPEGVSTVAAERFLREIGIAARLQHPHIVPLLDSGEAGGSLYLVMPYVEGESLRARLLREHRLGLAETLRIVGDVADALAYAHRKGVIHRDIKPDNILLAGRHALVADFGVAKAISDASGGARDLTTGIALGTPAYMAPEQATADPSLDHRVDLYALGVVAYELLAGGPPFDGPTPQAILTAHVMDAPPPLADRISGVPPALIGIIERALAKRPADRWQRAEELLAALEPLATPSGDATPAQLAPVLRTPGRWGWLLAGLAALGALVVGIRAGSRPDPARLPSQRQITFDGQVGIAEISPDGQLLAYVREEAGRTRLLIRDLRGGTALELASGSPLNHPSWSEDGSEVRYWSLDNNKFQHYAVPRLGGAPRLLEISPGVTVSPDGRLLARTPQGRNYLAIINPQTGESTMARVPASQWYTRVAWGGSQGPVTFAATSLDARQSRVLVATLPGGVPLIVAEESTAISRPTWGPDGRSLYYLRGPGPLADLMRLGLTARGTPEGKPAIVAAGLEVGPVDANSEFLRPVSIAPDGRHFYYTRIQEWSNLYVAGLDSARDPAPPRPLTSGSARYWVPRVSPDGRSLAYLRTQADGVSLQVLALAGGPSRPVGLVEAGSDLAWSPNGKTIAVIGADPDSGHALLLFPAKGGPGRRIFRGAVGDHFDWVNDSVLVAARPANRPLVLLDLATLRVRQLRGMDTVGWVFTPRVTSDGARIAFMRNPGGSAGFLVVLDTGGAAPRQLTPEPLAPVGWAPGDRDLIAGTAALFLDTARVYLFPSARGPARLLRTLPPGFQPEDLTPDGRSVVLNAQQRRSDVWVLELPAQP